MSETVTVEIRGIELPADDLEEAIDTLSTDADKSEMNAHEGGYGVVGDVAVKGDFCNDPDLYVARAEDVDILTEEQIVMAEGADKQWTNIEYVRTAIENARAANITDEDKVEHVADIVASGNTVVSTDDTDSINASGDVEVQYGHMKGYEMDDLADDEAVEFARVGYSGRTIADAFHVDEDVLAEQ